MTSNNTFGVHRVESIMRQLFAILLALGFVACEKSDDFLFELPIETRIQLPAGLNPFDSHFILAREVFNSFENLSAQFGGDTSSWELLPIRAEFIGLDANDGLGYIQEMTIFLFEGANPEEDDAFAFINDQISINATNILQLSPFSDNLARYLTGGKTNIKVKIRTRRTSTALIEGRLSLVFGARQI